MNSLPPIGVQKHTKITDGLYAVVFTAGTVNNKYNHEQMTASLSEITNNKLSFVEGTITRLPDVGYTAIYRGLVQANTENRPYTEESVGKMKSIASNIFHDEDDSMWKVVGEGNNRRIIQIGGNDFDAILAEKNNRSRLVASASTNISAFIDGDYAMVYNPQTNSKQFGFTYTDKNGKCKLFARSTQVETEIHPEQVICSSDINIDEVDNLPEETVEEMIEATAASDFSGTKYLEYMRTLYAGTAYFSKLESIIKNHPLS